MQEWFVNVLIKYITSGAQIIGWGAGEGRRGEWGFILEALRLWYGMHS